MPLADLRRAAMPTPVMSDHAIALPQKIEHLVVPVVARQRPTVMEHDGLCVLRAPVLEKDRGSVCRCDRAHLTLPKIHYRLSPNRRSPESRMASPSTTP